MLTYFKELSMKRGGWLLLLFSGLALEGTALYFQHGMNLSPCVMCIYERVALLGIVFAGIFGLIAPRFWLARLFALLLGLGSAIAGLLLALKHLDYQLNPGPWNQCSSIVKFPQTLPLDKWFPNVFHPYGSCSEETWSFLGFSMVQWIVVMFAFYALLFLILTISQMKKTRQARRLFR